ncbi:RAS1 protein [Spiromyces aspiralis]|uniref:RAS1 protein n=1 Tax=Spiromyces aspiralis TaxID=68401 RepID=A0ACC1I022_9FUNG|nr:RAS1 protein [Spiromyces aspiralis]
MFLEQYDPTIEDNYSHKCVIDGENALLDILDSAGQSEYSAMQDHYIRTGQGFVAVYNIASRNSFTQVKALLSQIRKLKQTNRCPVVVIGNKSDLDPSSREVSCQEGQELATKCGAAFFEASAKSGYNVAECFYQCVRQIRMHRRITLPPRAQSSSPRLSYQSAPPSSHCEVNPVSTSASESNKKHLSRILALTSLQSSSRRASAKSAMTSASDSATIEKNRVIVGAGHVRDVSSNQSPSLPKPNHTRLQIGPASCNNEKSSASPHYPGSDSNINYASTCDPQLQSSCCNMM